MPLDPTAGAPQRLTLSRLDTPVGEALVVVDEGGRLRAFDFGDHEDRMRRLMQRAYPGATTEAGPAPEPVRAAVDRYFAGDLDALASLTWATGGTPFQRRVWAALCDIPAGETWSYGRLAAHIGSPAAVRAVGLANGANPIAIAVPCHRVIGANGTLTGYGGGLARKQQLLEHEGAWPRERRLV